MEQTDVPGKEKDNSKDHQGQPPPPPPPLKGVEDVKKGETPTTPIQNIINIQQPKLSFWRKLSDPMTIIQLFIALGTLGTLLWYINISGKQSGQTYLSLAKTDHAAYLTQRAVMVSEKSLIQSKESSDQSYEIAKKTMEAQIEMTETDLRPYLCFDEPDTARGVKPHIGTYTTIIGIKNFGKTSAYDVSYGWACRLRPNFHNERFPIIGDTINIGLPFIPAGKGYGIGVSTKKNTIDKETLIAINNGKALVVFFIRLNYNQHIGNKIIAHSTQFGVFYDLNQNWILPYGDVDITGKGFDSDY